MAWKLEAASRNIYLSNTDTDILYSGGGSEFRFYKEKTTDTGYFVEFRGENIIGAAIPINHFVDKDGVVFTSATIKSFIDSNTGFNTASGGSGAGVLSVNNRTGNVQLTKVDLALDKVNNTTDSEKPLSISAQAALDLKVNLSLLNASNGVATLGTDSKLLAAQIPDSLLSGLKWQSTWNASTNTPVIAAAATGNKGFFYKVNVAGTSSITGASIAYTVGDWLISNGTVWQRVPNSESITSVSGKVGAVTLVKSDVGLANVDNTNDLLKPISTATQAALDAKPDLSTIMPLSNGEASIGSSSMAAKADHVHPLQNASVAPWDISKPYKANNEVKYTDGFSYTANADIPANTAWVTGTTGPTWSQLTTSFIRSPSNNGYAVKATDSKITVSNNAGRDIVRIDSGILLESYTENKSKIDIRDGRVTITSPGNTNVASARFDSELTRTTMRGPASTNDNTFIMYGDGETVLKVANVEKLNAKTTDTTLAANPTNRVVAYASGAVEAFAGAAGSRRLRMDESFATLYGGADTTNRLEIGATHKAVVGDVARLIIDATETSVVFDNNNFYAVRNDGHGAKVGNVEKVKINATRSDYLFDPSNYITVQSGRQSGYVGGNVAWDIDRAVGAYAKYGWNSGNCVNANANLVQMLFGGSDKLGVNVNESYLKYDSNNFITCQSNNAVIKANGVDKLSVNATTSSLLFNASNFFEASNGIAKMQAGGIDRVWANSTECRMRSPDTNTYLNLVNGTASIFAGGGEKFNLNATSSWVGFNSTNNFESTTDKAIVRSAGVERIWAVAASSGLRSPNSSADVSVANDSVAIKGGGSSGKVSFTVGSTERLAITDLITARATIVPHSTNAYDLGGASQRFATIYAQNALNTPSDMTLKENIKDIPDALLDAWGKHVSPKQFNWIAGGADGVIHFSFMAQHIIAAFDEAGLDWRKYGVVSGDGVNDKHGVAYTEAQIIETAYQRRKIAKLEAIIETMR